MRTDHVRTALRGFAIATVVALAAWAFWLEPSSLANTDHELVLEHWPTACSGLRIAVLSDLHVGAPHMGLDQLDAVIALTRRAEPDLVLLTGDYVTQGVLGGTFVAPENTAHALAALTTEALVFAVLGNHDWWFNGPRVRDAFEAEGIPVVDDSAHPIELADCHFWLVGVSDFWEGRHDVDGALARVPPDAAIVLFTHNPDVFPDVPARVTLTVAGHTHGGQVYLPGVGRPIVPSAYGERFAIGHIIEDGRHLFVASGIGTSIIPVRFLVPPEVSVLILRSSRGRSA